MTLVQLTGTNLTLDTSGFTCCFTTSPYSEHCLHTNTPCESPFYPIFVRSGGSFPVMLQDNQTAVLSNQELINYAHSVRNCVPYAPEAIASFPTNAFVTSVFFLGFFMSFTLTVLVQRLFAKYKSSARFVSISNNAGSV